MRGLDVLSFILLIVGGLNWGFWGLFDLDVVAYLFGGNTSAVSRIVYDLIGFAGLYMVFAGWTLRERWHVPKNIDVMDKAA